MSPPISPIDRPDGAACAGGGSDADEILLVLRQKRMLREGAVFIRHAAQALLAEVPQAGLEGDLADFLGGGDRDRQRRALDAVVDALQAAAAGDRRDPESVSLCVILTAKCADALEASGMALDEERLRTAMPALDVGWCRARHRDLGLAALPVAGHA